MTSPWLAIRQRIARWLDPVTYAVLPEWQNLAEQTLVENAQIARVEKAVRTLAWWLVQAQTGFGVQDARGIEDILDGAPGIHASAASQGQSSHLESDAR